MRTHASWITFFAIVFVSLTACAQLNQINPANLPPDPSLQALIAKVRKVEFMAHSWSNTWRYDTPKADVVSVFTSALQDLRSADAAAPNNAELWLLTGLVAHLGYNLDVDSTYDLAVDSFGKAAKLAPADYRPQWFLAAHRCQSNEAQSGMEQMLAVEAKKAWQDLPVEFWNDYINCSTIALMPAHTLRAVDHAIHLGVDPASYKSVVDITNNRYKTSDDHSKYSARDVWQATQGEKQVRFTNQLCGIGFTVSGDWKVDPADIVNGACAMTVETGPYPSKTGQGTPTILVLSRPAKPQESLEDFGHLFLKDFPTARPVTPTSCPADKCLAFEIIAKDMYASEGGAHLLLVAFAGSAPEFPGLKFETPHGPPKSTSGGDVTYYHPEQTLHRLPGVIYSVVELDSNESIFDKSSADFQSILKSIELD